MWGRVTVPVLFLLLKLLNNQCMKITAMKGRINTYLTKIRDIGLGLGFRVRSSCSKLFSRPHQEFILRPFAFGDYTGVLLSTTLRQGASGFVRKSDRRIVKTHAFFFIL